MIVSTTNAFFGSTVLTSTGTVIDGDTNDLTDPDFSFKLVFGGTSSSITIPSSTGAYSTYIGIHGIYTPNFGTVRVRVLDNGVEVFNEVVPSGSVVVPRASSLSAWVVEFSEYIGSLSVSYVAAGFSTEVPRSGVRGGQNLPYKGLNLETETRINRLAQPTNVVYRNKAPRVRITVPDAPIEWVSEGYQNILNLYRLSGVVSVLDFDDDPTTGSAGYDLSASVSTHPSSLAVQSATLEYSVAQ